jgi:hypothetical protein
MLALDLLRVPLAGIVLVGSEMPGVCAPIIGAIAGNPKGFQQRFPLQEHIVCTPAKDRGQHPTAPVIDGMPEPSLLFFLANKRPQFIDFCFIRTLDNDFYSARRQSVHQGFVDTDQRRGFFFNSCKE